MKVTKTEFRLMINEAVCESIYNIFEINESVISEMPEKITAYSEPLRAYQFYSQNNPDVYINKVPPYMELDDEYSDDPDKPITNVDIQGYKSMFTRAVPELEETVLKVSKTVGQFTYSLVMTGKFTKNGVCKQLRIKGEENILQFKKVLYYEFSPKTYEWEFIGNSDNVDPYSFLDQFSKKVNLYINAYIVTMNLPEPVKSYRIDDYDKIDKRNTGPYARFGRNKWECRQGWMDSRDNRELWLMGRIDRSLSKDKAERERKAKREKYLRDYGENDNNEYLLIKNYH